MENHIPSDDNIANWKGIDIIYFQEDLRKHSKANISEKSFYTYFKTSPVLKLPRIDILNLLSIYAGYISWYEFKKNHPLAQEILENFSENSSKLQEIKVEIDPKPIQKDNIVEEKPVEETKEEIPVIQINNSDLEEVKQLSTSNNTTNLPSKKRKKIFQEYIFTGLTAILTLVVGYLGFGDDIFGKTYTYNFMDADRNSAIANTLEVKVIKENESPIFYRIKPKEPFYYSTKDKNLKMVISSPFYENLEVNRNLDNAPDEETILLSPDDYKMAVYTFSKKDMRETAEEIKQKRRQLENLIAENAVIYQVFDSEIYGVETLNRQKYITLLTIPTTSLKNLNIIEMTKDKGKIVAIKFKIDNEKP
ncbi:hypothetical protein HNQ03_001802 [Chryseobacterium sp. 16F]|uniref:Uncharacterized protein n=1 Tax=Frigoriflavimonas asaccharolytica TaxID=2735899 RepID=A0A8J8G7H7_9FLAO|nr:hypothetical protein [Frigoriflavimonas asaccharolytica]